MKKFWYFFVVYFFVLIIGTRFFYAFSSEEIQDFIYNLSGESVDLEINQDLITGQNIDLDQNIQTSQESDLDQSIDLQIPQIQSGSTILLSGENPNSGQSTEIISGENLTLLQTLDAPQYIPNLSITEVFRDGTDERIEITNFGSQSFSGTIVISGAKSSIITVPSIIILSDQSLILGDNCSMISNLSCVGSTGLSMSISDTNQIDISIFYSGQQLDSFIVDQTTVNNYNNTDTSFEKLSVNSTLLITGTSIDRAYNINSGYLANPGIVQVISSSGSGFTGTLTGDSNLPNLSITEVFRDGTDEWIEITNFGTGIFIGNLKIYGATSSPFDINNISIPKDQSVIISDDNKYFIDNSNIIIHALSISDTSTISINLFYSGQILDSFYVPQDFVNSINNLKTSFERVINSGNLVTTIATTGRIYNLKPEYVLGGYVANPGKVWELSGNLTDISSTGNGITLDLSGLIIPIDCNNFVYNPFQITEIFSGNSQTSTFIELVGLGNFSGVVLFSGQGLSANFYINLDINTGERILITYGLQGILDEQKNIVNASLELAYSGGWVGVYGQNGQVLDIVYFVKFGTDLSSYFDGIYSTCARILSKYDNYSPGFNETLLSYFPQGTPVYLDKIVYVGGGGGGYSTCQSNTGSNNNTGSYNITGTNLATGQIKIISIDYDPEGSDTDRESIILQSLVLQDLDLNHYRLQVVGKDAKKMIRGEILYGNNTQTFIGNYQFPNTPSCINLLQDDMILDTYCYGTGNTFGNTNTGVNGTGVFSGTQNFTGDRSIKIVTINFNPTGTDSDNESITLELSGTQTINLSSLKLLIFKDNKVTKKSISGILSPGYTQTFIGNYQFPNTTNDSKNVVVSLVYNDIYILDTYSYNPNIPTDLPAAGIYNVYSIIDGDTFKIKNGAKNISIRLLGADAPESSKTRFGYIECFGSQSKEYLKNLIYKKDIMLQYDESQIVDSYGRVLGYVFLDGQNINEKIIKDGYAREYTHQNNAYQYQSIFRSAQNFSQQNSLGLWSQSTCSGLRIHVGSGTLININSGVYSTGNGNIKILSILPNPQGSDKGNEKISLIYKPSSSGQTLNLDQSIDLSQGYYLLIGTRKKYLTGILLAGEAKILIGDFAFPNKASCINIAKDKIILDTFCYDKADNGELFKINNGVLTSISNIDISILNSSKLQSFGSNLCLTYQGQIFHCKKIPSSKTSTKNQNKIKLYENYLNLIDDYLRQNRQVLFYNTDIKNYFNLLNEAKKNISDGIYYVNINGKYIQTTDIAQRYDIAYNQTSYDFILNGFKNYFIGNDIVAKYNKLKEEYFARLANN
ncbi:MAG: thermonuclease family protein [Candidatus Absconditicoccaceae bacterium]